MNERDFALEPTSVPSVAAALLLKTAGDLIVTARAIPEDRAHWQPAPDARSVIDQLVECCLANSKWAQTLRTRVHTPLPTTFIEESNRELQTITKATERLWDSTAQLAGVIRALTGPELGLPIQLPWKPEVTRTVAECCFHAYWNMAYHEGQISYIQTLYGDQEEYTDAGPFGVDAPLPIETS
jgi:uncharacterized damage-inducible protein DinB